jgi:hypothetical protein
VTIIKNIYKFIVQSHLYFVSKIFIFFPDTSNSKEKRFYGSSFIVMILYLIFLLLFTWQLGLKGDFGAFIIFLPIVFFILITSLNVNEFFLLQKKLFISPPKYLRITFIFIFILFVATIIRAILITF